jgi:hypothetical protein
MGVCLFACLFACLFVCFVIVLLGFVRSFLVLGSSLQCTFVKKKKKKKKNKKNRKRPPPWAGGGPQGQTWCRNGIHCRLCGCLRHFSAGNQGHSGRIVLDGIENWRHCSSAHDLARLDEPRHGHLWRRGLDERIANHDYRARPQGSVGAVRGWGYRS